MTTLKTWMRNNNFTNSSLAERLGISYESVYKIAEDIRPVSNGFKWRFTQAFGLETAQSIFADHDESMRPFTTLSPKAELVTK